MPTAIFSCIIRCSMNDGLMIKTVAKESIAQELGILAGETLLCINNRPVRDCIDYAYYMAEEELLLLLRDGDGNAYEAEIEKQPYQDIGLTFERDGLGAKRVCRNNCLFCFVNQMPKGLRKTLYVKDDDWRLSFLMGNYITLTNLSDGEMDRILEQKISPLYCSVHASDDEVRVKLLGTERARVSFERLCTLVEGGITLHMQIVLCEGFNDGDILQQTLQDLYALYPGVQSVAVVPVGLTKYREGLEPLQPVSQSCAQDAIERITALQKKSMGEQGTSFAFASDELYIRAGLSLPTFEEYEEFPQIENGVGLVAKIRREVSDAIQAYATVPAKKQRYATITGVDFYPYMLEIAAELQVAFGVRMEVHRVQNAFFGESVTVAGLLTGRDVIAQLQGKLEADVLLLPRCCFRENTSCMLDDVTLEELAMTLGVACEIVDVDGYCLVERLIEKGD